jgi:hypothetical protein
MSGLATWLTTTVPHDRLIVGYEVRHLLQWPGMRALVPAVLALLATWTAVALARRGSGGSRDREPERTLTCHERARRLMAGGVRRVDAARETGVAQDGLELLLRLSRERDAVEARRIIPWRTAAGRGARGRDALHAPTWRGSR